MRAPVLLAAALLALAACTMSFTGCGGDDNSGEARELLRKGFGAPIGSANLSVDLTARLEGIPQQRGPVKVKLAGPYRSNEPGRLPDADLDVEISGGGQTFSLGLISTGDRAYVRFGGTPYEVSEATVRRLNRPAGSGGGPGLRGALRDRFGADPLNWVTNPETDGDATVNGVPTDHVRADVDVEKALRDLNKVVARTAPPGRPPPTLDDEQIAAVRDRVEDPKLDVYVGRDDGRIRRVSLDLAFDVPEESRRRLNGLSSGTITLDVELTEVGQPQRIDDPRGVRPMSELNRLLGGRGILGLLFGATTGRPQPGAPGSPTPQQLEAYRDCIDRAKPSDTAALARCNELVR